MFRQVMYVISWVEIKIFEKNECLDLAIIVILDFTIFIFIT